MLIGVVCSDHGIAIFAKIMKTIFNMLLIIGPILCIVALGYYLIMVIKSPDADQKNVYFKNIKNSFFALLIVIFLPIIVNVVMGLTMVKDSFQIAACWEKVEKAQLSASPDDLDDEKIDSDKVNTFIINPSDYVGKGTNDTNNENNNNNNNINTNTNTTSSNGMADAFVKLAVAQKQDPSATGGKKYWQYIGKKKHTAWCAAFVSWVVGNTEYNGEKMTKYFNYKSQSCGKFIKYCKRHEGSTYHQRGYVPKRGDLIFYDWDNNGVQNHVGIVQYVKDGKIKTIEGNCKNKIKERIISVDHRTIFGFCSWY